MSFFSNLSISKKILLGILPVFMLFVIANVLIENYFHEVDMTEEARKAAIVQSAIIKESMVSMMVSNLRVDTTFMRTLARELDSVRVIVNDLYLRPEVVSPELLIMREKRPQHEMDEIGRTVLRSGEPVFRKEGNIFRSVIPFRATKKCQECHAVPLDYVLGGVDIRVSVSHVAVIAEENLKRAGATFLLFSVLGMIVATFMFNRFVGTPINRLVEATTEISTGRLESGSGLDEARGLLSERAGSDELRFLASKFNRMRLSLKEKISQIDDANRKLAARNAQIEDALARLRQAQEDLVRNERLAVTGRMTAQLSHEINNPIHNIQSLLETSLGKLKDNDEVHELISIAQEEVGRMANLTRQMLDFYRGSVVELDRKAVNLRELLEEIVIVYREKLEAREISLQLLCEPDLPAVRGSADKLKQVFLNLINNAADAITSPGKVSIRAEALNGTILIEVSDTGSGIEPAHVGRIFDPFFTTKKEVSGVGLGLFVTYGIIQQHDGSIRVTSQQNKGTTFTIELPANSVGEAAAAG